MIIFPAIDIKGGECVRLLKGDFNQITKYNKSPLDQALEFFNLGFKNIHIVDLDGALKENPVNKNLIKEIGKINKLKIQVGGGIRSIDHIKQLIDFGVDKIIVGTAAVENNEFLKIACDKFKNKIALSIDVRDKYIALSGWKKQTKILATDFVQKFKNTNISRIIYTDINKDGTKTGPNIIETLDFSNLTKTPTVISGGVSSLKDVIDVKKNNFPNIEGIIVGKSIYDGNIDINELSKII
jgi:phosphoribosylformimino-5-aminoimidazole carboxamide ribotide isomerase